MATANTPMRGLFKKLDSAGIPPAFAKKMLPAWWEDEVASDPAGLQQAQLYLSRAFNIELQSLADEGSPPAFRASLRKFKLSRNVSEDTVSVSANYATGISRLALQAYRLEQKQVPVNPSDLRKVILVKHQCVSLISLLEWCISAGIPVLHIEKLPGKKMTGLVVRDGGRFAIVLSKRGHPAHLLFHLAHELGHIAKNHLAQDGFVADEKIDSSSGDADEKEADAYAICLLNGSDIRYRAGGVIKSGHVLHKAAVAKGKEMRVDAGHIIANFGHNQDRYAMAAIALADLGEPSQGNAVINGAFFRAIDRDLVSEDQLDLLKVATGYTD
ncbi:ImmA/IrrE family metallo-endopeptidase [Polaromonas sp. JS666]|uniref:ImmA/IrrE family metallo-endopeptidase n=1 Tax=Polaromonas sp. (strain JS666 / ATCC BAA-500) TaxID=296591 RepID=UPI000053800D|nr:ImmA/IrrE family metallo-endopeptidase [Polaromonas sp. JS666]ABE42912.1 conserved hypothetical protein [Polaromonas sp. JS666]